MATEVIYYPDGTTQTVQHPDPPKSHVIFSKTAFNKYAATQFGSMGRFQDILDASEASTGSVKFCFTQYVAAITFEKSEVEYFTNVMVTATPPIMTVAERDAVLNNWPMV